MQNLRKLSKKKEMPGIKNMQGISIVIPFYNSSQTIDALFESIRTQLPCSCQKEIIVVDDGSDELQRNALLASMPNEIQYVCLYNNSGPLYARIEGIKKARFPYIMLIDSDDILAKNALAEIEPYMLDDYDFIAFDIQKSDGSLIKPFEFAGPQSEANTLLNLFINGKAGFTGTKVFKKELFNVAFETRIPRISYLEDSLLNLFLYKERQHKTFYIPKPLYLWNVGTSNLSRTYSPSYFECASLLYRKRETLLENEIEFQNHNFSIQLNKWYVTTLREIFCGCLRNNSFRKTMSGFKGKINVHEMKVLNQRALKMGLSKRDRFFLFCCNTNSMFLFNSVFKIATILSHKNKKSA